MHGNPTAHFDSWYALRLRVNFSLIYIPILSILHPVCKTTLFKYTATNVAFQGRADLEPSGRIKPVLIPNE